MGTSGDEDANRKSGIAYGAGLVLFTSVSCRFAASVGCWIGGSAPNRGCCALGTVLGAIARFLSVHPTHCSNCKEPVSDLLGPRASCSQMS